MAESDLSQRLDRLVQVVINRYLPALVGVMGERNIDPAEQRRRVDRLVRSLVDWQLDDRITRDGRPIPVRLQGHSGSDKGSDSPRVIFNRGLMEKVSDEEMRQALREPIEQLLELSSMSVELVLSIDDDEKLKRLAARSEGSATVQLADVPAVIERRLKVFASRVNRLVARLGGPDRVIRGGLGPLREHLTDAADVWPSWDDLREIPGVEQIIRRVRDGLPDDYNGPDGAVLVELFWESLDLSATSFLRHAATSARGATRGPDGLQEFLRTIGRILEQEGAQIPVTARDWTAFEPVFDAWNELFRSEQRILAWTTEGRATPTIDMFEAPRRSLGLAEPDTLPWDFPLLCWTVRERDALRDLLDGTRESLVAGARAERDDHFEVAPWEMKTSSFEVGQDTHATFTTKVVQAARRSSSNREHVSGEIRRQALGACWQWLERKFRVMNVAEQHQLLETLRAGYDGFFGDSSVIWSRRFQSCDTIDTVEAFRVLSGELRHLLGPTMLFDGYADVRDPHPDEVPNFVCVVGLPTDRREIRFRLPLVALKSCWDQAPLLVRVVEVEGGRTTWLDDLEFTERNLLNEETDVLIDSFEQDHVTMLLRRLN